MSQNNILSRVYFIANLTPFIIIISSLMGGIIQIINLLKLSKQYLFFFSVSQLINDSIIFSLIYISFICVFFYHIILYFLIKSLNKVLSFIATGLITFIIYFSSERLVISILNFKIETILIGSFFFQIIVLTFLDNFIQTFKKYKYFFYNLLTLFLFLVALFSYNIYEKISLPRNTLNALQIVKNESKKYKNVKKTEIVYMNDKYIFISLKFKKNKFIKVLRFEEYFSI